MRLVLVNGEVYLKGHNRQHSGQIFKTEKTIEIQPFRPTEVYGKV